MHRFFVLLLISILTMSLITGCGQSQQQPDSKKPIVINPEETVADISESEEAPQPEEAVSDITEPATDNESDARDMQIENTTEVPAVTEAPVVAVEAPKAEAPKYSERIIAADFNSGEKPNNLGGNFGAWNKDPSDPTQWCKESFDNVTRYGDTGFAMKLDYGVDSPNPAYNGFWMTLPNFDATKYDALNLWVKGDPKTGYTTVFKIELKSANKQVGRYYVSNASDQWQEISIPLSEFKGLIDRSSLTELVIVFEDRMASNKKGVLYIDDIGFVKK